MERLPNGSFWVERDEPLPDPLLTPSHGILAVGGSLTGPYLIEAYRKGIFPWNNPGERTLWWYPEERMVVTPDSLYISKSMQSLLRKGVFRITYNKAYPAVLQGCARKGEDSWLSEALMQGMLEAHQSGVAVSVEAWQGMQLVGGLIGMQIGRFFSGDSMFSLVSNASKAAFLTFAKQAFEQGLELIDCQVPSDHLRSLGGIMVTRKVFTELLHG